LDYLEKGKHFDVYQILTETIKAKNNDEL